MHDGRRHSRREASERHKCAGFCDHDPVAWRRRESDRRRWSGRPLPATDLPRSSTRLVSPRLVAPPTSQLSDAACRTRWRRGRPGRAATRAFDLEVRGQSRWLRGNRCSWNGHGQRRALARAAGVIDGSEGTGLRCHTALRGPRQGRGAPERGCRGRRGRIRRGGRAAVRRRRVAGPSRPAQQCSPAASRPGSAAGTRHRHRRRSESDPHQSGDRACADARHPPLVGTVASVQDPDARRVTVRRIHRVVKGDASWCEPLRLRLRILQLVVPVPAGCARPAGHHPPERAHQQVPSSHDGVDAGCEPLASSRSLARPVGNRKEKYEPDHERLADSHEQAGQSARVCRNQCCRGYRRTPRTDPHSWPTAVWPIGVRSAFASRAVAARLSGLVRGGHHARARRPRWRREQDISDAEVGESGGGIHAALRSEGYRRGSRGPAVRDSDSCSSSSACSARRASSRAAIQLCGRFRRSVVRDAQRPVPGCAAASPCRDGRESASVARSHDGLARSGMAIATGMTAIASATTARMPAARRRIGRPRAVRSSPRRPGRASRLVSAPGQIGTATDASTVTAMCTAANSREENQGV